VISVLAGVAEIDGAPFDIEDAIWLTAGHRGVNTAGSARESRAARVCIRALVVPVRKDSVVVRSPRQANIGKGRIGGGELCIAVG